MEMKELIVKNEKNLVSVNISNEKIKKEIDRIKFDEKYQYELVKKNLDVYHADEYILFFTN